MSTTDAPDLSSSPTDEPADASPPTTAAEESLTRLLRSMPGGGAILQVHRRERGHSGPYAYLTDADPTAFSLSWLREEWGGGHYLLRPYRTGDGYLEGSATVRIAGEPRTPDDTDTGRDPDEPPAWARRLMERVDRLDRGTDSRSMMEAIITAASRQSEAMMAAVTPLLERLHAREGRELDAMISVFERGLDLGGGMDSDSGLDRVISDLGLPLVDALTDRSEREPRQPADAPTPTPALVPNPPPETDQPRPGWATVLAPEIDQLCGLAELHADVDYWARQIVAEAPDEMVEWIADEVRRPREFAGEVGAWFPRAVPHVAWLRRLFEAIYNELAGAGWYDEPAEGTDAGSDTDPDDD